VAFFVPTLGTISTTLLTPMYGTRPNAGPCGCREPHLPPSVILGTVGSSVEGGGSLERCRIVEAPVGPTPVNHSRPLLESRQFGPTGDCAVRARGFDGWPFRHPQDDLFGTHRVQPGLNSAQMRLTASSPAPTASSSGPCLASEKLSHTLDQLKGVRTASPLGGGARRPPHRCSIGSPC